MRLVFAGTPQAAVPALDALLSSRHMVAAVVTRPDAPAGRGLRLAPSPVAQRAAEAGIEVLKPARPRDPDFLDRLRAIAPDCCPVTAYGALIPQAALDIPGHGWVNLHFSLLPAWRGAAPVQHAILHGDDITGATTFRLVRELDAGPVFGVVTEPIRPTDTAGDLLARLAASGAELLVATLDGIESGQLEARPQPAEGVTLAPKITAEDARVRWDRPAIAVDRQIRACTPSPGAWTVLGDARLKLWPLAAIQPAGGPAGGPATPAATAAAGAPGGRPAPPAADSTGGPLAPGELRVLRSAVLVGTATTPVQLGDLQPPGKRRMSAVEWARGLHLADRARGRDQDAAVLV
ncbi:MAG TPA: methionyl-tRNA formyltransferase [Streptosporangiaceae bacterium]|nr:methionyl-tRNA formyltransferase [Streptosporangiaceae bacterium]